eukprot:scaffold17018_cov60-Phaeocystis_antarctica.AAC.4
MASASPPYSALPPLRLAARILPVSMLSPVESSTRHVPRACNLPVHGLATALVRVAGVRGFHRRSRGHRRSPLKVHSSLLELRCRARPLLPSAKHPAEHYGPHLSGWHMVRSQLDNPRRQRLEPLVIPPLRLCHFGARLLPQHVKAVCRGLCPLLRTLLIELAGLEEPLCGLHMVPRVAEHCTEIGECAGLVGPQGDGLAVDPCCSAPVLLSLVPQAVSHQFRVRASRLCGLPARLFSDRAKPPQPKPTILRFLPMHLHLLVIHRVQLPSARVRGALEAAPVRRQQLVLDALAAHRVLLPRIVHV